MILLGKVIFLAAMTLVGACGCITNAASKKEAAPEMSSSDKKERLPGIKVGTQFQNQMFDQLEKDKNYTSAYGLFSEGGWSNAGQVWILANEDFSDVKIFKVAANKETPSEVENAKDKAAAIQKLRETLKKSADLKAVEETMFDGLIYEYTAIVRKGQHVQMETNVYIKTTDLSKHPKHGELIEAFAAL